MGGKQISNRDTISFDKLSDEEKENMDKERKKFKKIIDLITVKINERFKNLLHCFRSLDTDH